MISPFFCATTSTTETNTLSLHDALPISFQEFRRHAHGNIWRRRSEWQGRQSKVSGRFADEDGDCVFELGAGNSNRSEEHTSELQSHSDLVCRLLLEKKNDNEQLGDVKLV